MDVVKYILHKGLELFLAGGVGATLSFILFRFVMKSWISHQFNKSLEEVKTELSISVARHHKLYDKEYEVFPEIWERLIKARDSLQACLGGLKQYPNFPRMSEDDILIWADNHLDEDEKDFFLSKKDKIIAISRIDNARAPSYANEEFYKFKHYYEINKIFLKNDVKIIFDDILKLMRGIWVDRKMQFEDISCIKSNTIKKFEKELIPLMDKIEISVQNRLFP